MSICFFAPSISIETRRSPTARRKVTASIAAPPMRMEFPIVFFMIIDNLSE